MDAKAELPMKKSILYQAFRDDTTTSNFLRSL